MPARLAHRAAPILIGAALFGATAFGAPLAAQRDEAPPEEFDDAWREDPFTENDPEALKRAGYVAIDKIGWSQGYGSQRIEQALGRVKIHWIETAHFRLGFALKSWKLPGHDKAAKKRVRDELRALHEKLPAVPKSAPKSFSPWLRAHLWAARLEKLFADYTALVEFGDVDGEPPFLHCRDKFRVAVFDEASASIRFAQTFGGPADTDSPMRWYHQEDDVYVFTSAVGFADETYGDDTAFYCHTAFHVAHMLMDAHRRSYGNWDTPIWWKEGLAHSIRRRIAEDNNVFTSIARRDEHTFAATDWEYRVHGLMKHGIQKPFEAIRSKMDYEDLSLQDHMEFFSRVEFLRATDESRFGEFVARLALPATPERRLQDQDEALAELFGFDTPTAFDEAWVAWARKAYRKAKKKR